MNISEYLNKLKNLQILPLCDLLHFHRIIQGKMWIDLPEYIQLASPPTSLRASHIDALYFYSSIKPHLTTFLKINPQKFQINVRRSRQWSQLWTKLHVQEFQHSYFYRIHLQWNKLPLKTQLNMYLWNSLMERLNDNMVYYDSLKECIMILYCLVGLF